ncbi:c-type cytochrome biogenesis protein CcmI [Thioalkalivibrio denitrificans]|uniref:C-type cytochrome biogenesis protein CcmI n=1 Tax=Thioalkalivibrio denitrificans TaxID=108003 RepID=A0A1V3NL25_9GAMM|nr:c-type cytochrome biogenesis protein CcmI [Thioalkalivibrio denitrificans]OOG25694.1 c-type cytochrome biogenesis protein CcmI [Thioalkalivibrio denitrificans]
MNAAFVIALAAFIVGAVGFVVYPLLRSARPGAKRRTRRDVNAAIYRDRLAELDYDMAHGTLTRQQYDAAVADLEEELVQSGALDPEDNASGRKSGQRLLLVGSGAVAALGVPLLALALYGNVGFVDAVPTGGAQSMARGGQSPSDGAVRMPTGPDDVENLAVLADRLRARLAENPEDRVGWALLGRTLVVLDRIEESSEAFATAVALDGYRDPDLLVQYADVLAEVRGGLEGEPKELIDKALELAPDHPQALWLAGSADYFAADYDGARHYWERLLSVLPPDSESASIVRSNLERIAAGGDG